MSITEAFEHLYTSAIQLSPLQARAISLTIVARKQGCNLLVFGVGNDTGLWLRLNDKGHTHFLETSQEWLQTVLTDHPSLSVSLMPTFGLTVASSQTLTEKDLTPFAILPELLAVKWDVIIVDAPPGYTPSDPGRAVAIYWAAKLAHPLTDVFVDDYERALEQHFADEYLRKRRQTSTLIVPASDAYSSRKLLWSMARPC